MRQFQFTSVWVSELVSSFFKMNIKHFSIIAFVLGFILYGNTSGHSYALDDAIVITQNEFTKQGFEGISDILTYDSFTGFFGKEKQLVDGGRYRPLSLITFAIEYQFFGQEPTVSHLINILIYILVSVLIFQLIIQLFSISFDSDFAHKLAIFTALLFMLHPIHTEVVANIKGRDELLSLMFSLLAFQFSLKFVSGNKALSFVSSLLFLFLALMSKENSIAFVVIIPLALWFFASVSFKKVLLSSVPLLTAALLFLTIRYNVLGGFQQNVAGELMNNPFLYATIEQKYATIIYTWFIYLKLLVFPYALTFDYYPYHIPLVKFSNPYVIVSSLIVLALSFVSISGLKKRTIASFSIIGFVATFSMVSNLFFPVGTFMNERFVFMPSFFFCLAIAFFLIKYFSKKNIYVRVVVVLVVIYMLSFFSIKTIARNRAWENDLTLFEADVKTSFESAKSNCSVGGKLWEQGKKIDIIESKNKLFEQSEKHLRKALEIHPDYVDAWLLLGNVLFETDDDVSNSASCFIEVINRQPMNDNAWSNIDIVLQKSTDRNLQMKYYSILQQTDSNRYIINYRLGVLHGRYSGDLAKGIYFFKRAVAINSSGVGALKDLGTAYGIMGEEKLAYETCKKALLLDDNDAQIYINLGIAATKLGFKEEADNYFLKAEQLNSELSN